MMTDTPPSYKILRCLLCLQGRTGVLIESIIRYTRIDNTDLLTALLSRMQDKDDLPGCGALIDYNTKSKEYRIAGRSGGDESTGGYKYLYRLKSSGGAIQTNNKSFRIEALTGMDSKGNRTQFEKVALPNQNKKQNNNDDNS